MDANTIQALRDMYRKSDTYTVNMACTNCGHTYVGTFDKGQRVAIKEPCPRCGCAAASKRW